MTFLTKQGLFHKNGERRIKDVPLPNGMTARIQHLTAGEMRQLRTSLMDKKGELIRKRADRLQELLVSRCLVDEQGNRMLTDEDAMSAEMDALDGALVAALFRECRDWTGFAADADWQAIEDAAKNSESTP